MYGMFAGSRATVAWRTPKSRSREYSMPRSRKPIHFEPLTGPDAYERLEFFARRFAQGRYNCLVFVGPPGRLKSSIIERTVKDKVGSPGTELEFAL